MLINITNKKKQIFTPENLNTELIFQFAFKFLISELPRESSSVEAVNVLDQWIYLLGGSPLDIEDELDYNVWRLDLRTLRWNKTPHRYSHDLRRSLYDLDDRHSRKFF